MATGKPHKSQERMQRKAAQLDKAASRLSSKAAQLQQMSEWLGTYDVWTRPEPGARRSRLSRDEIAVAALRIVDSEGFDALSMRRLALELQVGTMSVYHYVRNRDELLMLLTDEVMGEVALPDGEQLPGTPRAAIMTIAARTRATLRRHPWVLDLHDDIPVGPNAMRHFDQSMQAVSGLDMSLTDKADLVAFVDEYVFGYASAERQGTDPMPAEMLDYFAGMVGSGDFPTLAAIVAEHGVGAAFDQIDRARTDPDRFERNLNRLLDGAGVP